ncbi:MAG TPA: hypothetical protein VJ723_00910, partial [Candidatus Angelobacter sp.]|nr:hypothetical protein [Candidatus Angelobacter sp.]
INWLELIIGAVIGIVATVFIQEPLSVWWRQFRDERHKPERVIADADRHRRLLTESDLDAALKGYESIIDDKNADLQFKIQAYQGKSRAYSQLAVALFWRGLPQKQYPQKAEDFASEAQRRQPGQFETGLALAYSYAARELESQSKPTTLQKTKELLINNPDNRELKYLAWAAGLEQQRAFADSVDPQQIDDLMMLLDIAAFFTQKAEDLGNQKFKKEYLERARAFLDRAATLAGDNELVDFRKGYLAQVNGQWAAAADYYKKAIAKQTDFPRARDNLAAIYASQHQYQAALDQLLDIVSNEDAPAGSRVAALHNLGEVYVELADNTEACKKWKEATDLAREETLLGDVHTAMCSYLNGDLTRAKLYYRKAIVLTKRKRISVNLLDADTFRNKWKVGPKELETAQGLIKLVT